MYLAEGAGLVATSFRTLPPCRAVIARDVREAVQALAAAENPAVIAGGTDLPARFNEGFCPDALVDISRIESLRAVRLADGALEIGACLTHAEGPAHPLIREHLPGFAVAWSRIANVRVRFAATIGGNLMARRTRYEAAILLTALGAQLRFASPEGESSIPAGDIWTARLPRAALLTTIAIPLQHRLRLDYERALRPIMTQALAVDSAGNGRLVVTTEFAEPRLCEVINWSLAQGALDAPFQDPVTSDAYIRRVAPVLIARQAARLKSA